MAHAAKLEAQHGVGTGLIEGDSQTIHVPRHCLSLRHEMTIRCIQTEPVIDVEGRHAEFNLSAG